jgi:hypothetical protein
MEVAILGYTFIALIIGFVALFLGYRELKRREQY